MRAFFSSKKATKDSNEQAGRGFKIISTSAPKAVTDMAPPNTTIRPGMTVLTSYDFADVAIPPDFLTVDPPDAEPVTIKQIDWADTVLPGNGSRYAAVLDNVLSPSECETMLRLVEESVPADRRGEGGDRFWQPALVNVGNGYEALYPQYRNSDRIIWDQQEVMDRLWERCARAPGLREKLSVVENDDVMLGPSRKRIQRWEFRRFNKRMRFLKYGPGQFFKAHNDSAYREPGETPVKTIFTVHLYLNDSKAEVGDEAALVGGATSFLTPDEKKKVDVNPKAGRVLIFQHYGLYHSGDEVKEGIKYTMRTDILYEMTNTETASE